MNKILWRRGALLAALAVLLAVGLVACGSEDEAGTNTGVISAITIIDKAGLHDIDDTIKTKQTIPPTARTTALHLQTVTLLTDWPKDLKGPAKKLATAFGELAASVDSDKPDLAKASTAAHEAHEVAHDFSQAVWAHLQAEAGVKANPPAND